MMSKCKTKDNDFEKLIDDCGIEVEYDDLLKMLDAKLDMFSKLYLWILSAFASLTLLKNIIEPIMTKNIYILFLWWILFFVAIGLIIYSILTAMQIQPFHKQREIFQDFIKARARLRELKNEED